MVYKGQVSSDLVPWADIAIPAPTAVNTESVTVTDAGFPAGPLNPKRFIRVWLAK